MNIKKFTINNLEYNQWTQQTLINWLLTKPEELLYKEIPSSFPSMIKTFNHIWTAQENWWAIVSNSSDFVDRTKVDILRRDEIFNGLLSNSKKLSDYANSLTEEQLSEHVKIETPIFKCDMPKYEYFQHIINHGTYHRGQIITIGRNVGLTDAPMTDYNIYRGRF